MKLIIQIPCLNEEETLPAACRDLPKQISGIDRIEVLVIDDGSTDHTSDVARLLGVHHVLRLTSNQGLARAFARGLESALNYGADIIVNTDGDNQYHGADIPALIEPIVHRRADIVVGVRDIRNHRDFSLLKKLFQRLGSWIVRHIAGCTVPDVTSGFRAYSREAALRLNIFSEFTYTLESLIQAGVSGLAVAHVPIRTNPKLRESRLFSSIGQYIIRSLISIIRVYTMYNPLKVFSAIAGIFTMTGLILVARFFYFYFTISAVQTGHVQSLIVAAILLIIGFQIFLFGLLADITAKNRRLLEEILLRLKRNDSSGSGEGHNRDK